MVEEDIPGSFIQSVPVHFLRLPETRSDAGKNKLVLIEMHGLLAQEKIDVVK